MPVSEVIDLTSLSDSDAENPKSQADDNDAGPTSAEGSEDSEIEITLNAETRAQLQKAIDIRSALAPAINPTRGD